MHLLARRPDVALPTAGPAHRPHTPSASAGLAGQCTKRRAPFVARHATKLRRGGARPAPLVVGAAAQRRQLCAVVGRGTAAARGRRCIRHDGRRRSIRDERQALAVHERRRCSCRTTALAALRGARCMRVHGNCIAERLTPARRKRARTSRAEAFDFERIGVTRKRCELSSRQRRRHEHGHQSRANRVDRRDAGRWRRARVRARGRRFARRIVRDVGVRAASHRSQCRHAGAEVGSEGQTSVQDSASQAPGICSARYAPCACGGMACSACRQRRSSASIMRVRLALIPASQAPALVRGAAPATLRATRSEH